MGALSRAAVLAPLLPAVCRAATWALQQCPGKTCDDPSLPLIDFDGENCVCREHPCWNDQGRAHSCFDASRPHLHFHYKEDGTLVCSCQAWPSFGSVYIARDVCPGEACLDKETPLLDYNGEAEQCECGESPCMDDGGVQHFCEDEEFPVLTFSYDGKGKLQCKCARTWARPETAPAL